MDLNIDIILKLLEQYPDGVCLPISMYRPDDQDVLAFDMHMKIIGIESAVFKLSVPEDTAENRPFIDGSSNLKWFSFNNSLHERKQLVTVDINNDVTHIPLTAKTLFQTFDKEDKSTDLLSSAIRRLHPDATPSSVETRRVSDALVCGMTRMRDEERIIFMPTVITDAYAKWKEGEATQRISSALFTACVFQTYHASVADSDICISKNGVKLRAATIYSARRKYTETLARLTRQFEDLCKNAKKNPDLAVFGPEAHEEAHRARRSKLLLSQRRMVPSYLHYDDKSNKIVQYKTTVEDLVEELPNLPSRGLFVDTRHMRGGRIHGIFKEQVTVRRKKAADKYWDVSMSTFIMNGVWSDTWSLTTTFLTLGITNNIVVSGKDHQILTIHFTIFSPEAFAVLVHRLETFDLCPTIRTLSFNKEGYRIGMSFFEDDKGVGMVRLSCDGCHMLTESSVPFSFVDLPDSHNDHSN